jgi:hypothetical protein
MKMTPILLSQNLLRSIDSRTEFSLSPMQAVDTFERERAELERVLASQLFSRAANCSRVLHYLCEKHFQGDDADLKEYSIAVDALRRPPDFDPQTDTVVRVTLHTVRKRLKHYYELDGRSNPMRIILPLGHYAPQFIDALECLSIMTDLEASDTSVIVREADVPSQIGPLSPLPNSRWWRSVPQIRIFENRVTLALICCAIGLLAGIFASSVANRRSRYFVREILGGGLGAVRFAERMMPRLGDPPLLDHLDQAIRIRAGATSDYVDTAGFRWLADRYFTGGVPFRRDVQAIARSSDPQLYSGGRMGTFEYAIPVKPGTYEVHLLFAETNPNFIDNGRDVNYTIGVGEQHIIDVLADAGGFETSTTKIESGVKPGADGKLHIAFQCALCFVNAVEVIPDISGRPNVIRISANRRMYIDPDGRHWLPERFESGGHNAIHVFSKEGTDSVLLQRERYGSFDYLIPVAEGFRYRVTLHMAERYWGSGNSGKGGIGSRVFDVWCNNIPLLTNFDILKAQGTADWVAVTFADLKPDITGKLDIQFKAKVDYPLVNAIEVSPE